MAMCGTEFSPMGENALRGFRELKPVCSALNEQETCVRLGSSADLVNGAKFSTVAASDLPPPLFSLKSRYNHLRRRFRI